MGSDTIHTGIEPLVVSAVKPPKHEKYAENLIECHKFHTVQTKKFSVAISEGACPPSLHPWGEHTCPLNKVHLVKLMSAANATNW